MGGCSGGGAGGGALAGARAVVDLGRGPQLTVRGAAVLSVVLSVVLPVLPAGVRHPDVLHHLLLSVGGRNLVSISDLEMPVSYDFGVSNPISLLLLP